MASLQAPAHEPPSIISSALARFEYEAGRTVVADATKVLLVEWEEFPQLPTQHPTEQPHLECKTEGEWLIEWKGRREAFKGSPRSSDADPARRNALGSTVVDSDHHHEQPGKKARSRSRGSSQTQQTQTHRLYFLLAPGAPVPPTVSITFKPSDPSSSPQSQATPALPAIFPAPLLRSATSPSSGKKGVLHTLWAKARIAALSAEIEAEERERLEGVGLEMAKGELEWICENFGVGPAAVSSEAGSGISKGDETEEETANGHSTENAISYSTGAPPSPLTPHSPSSSNRLLSKMGGLRVGTSPTTTTFPLQPGLQSPPNILSAEAAGIGAGKNPLSPDEGDVAVGAFAEIRGSRSNTSRALSSPAKGSSRATKSPASMLPSQPVGASAVGVASLDSVLGAGPQFEVVDKAVPRQQAEEHEHEDEGLFAVAMSPRSPETKTSPFSFAR